MIIDIVTLFPEMIAGALDHSIVKRAQERGIVTIRVVDLRDFTTDRHRTADDIPYGGGGGMILKVEPIARALTTLTAPQAISSESVELESHFVPQNPSSGVNYNVQVTDSPDSPDSTEAGEVPTAIGAAPIGSRQRPRVVLTDPRGSRFDQSIARQWAQEEHIVLLCGHYEGVDERVRQHLVTDEISIGDYILTGGELPALIIVDALTRLQPDALGDEQAPDKDSFTDDLLEYPHYTRPREYAGWKVPDILLCGHHAQIERWRRWHQLRATRTRRPDLFARLDLSAKDLKLLAGEEPTAPPDLKAAARNRPTPGTEGREHASPEEPRSPIRESAREADAPHLPVTTDPIGSHSADRIDDHQIEEMDGTGT